MQKPTNFNLYNIMETKFKGYFVKKDINTSPKIKVIKVHRGNNGKAEEIYLDSLHDFFTYSIDCEIPKILNVPISVLRQFNFNDKNKGPHSNNRVTKLMITKLNGFAPFEWSMEIGDAYVGRKDKVDFSLDDFNRIFSYIEFLLEDVYGSDEMDENCKIPEKYFTEKFYMDYIKKNFNKNDEVTTSETKQTFEVNCDEEVKFEKKQTFGVNNDKKEDKYEKKQIFEVDYDDEDDYDPEQEKESLSRFIKKNPFWSKEKIIKFNIDNNRPERNINFNNEMYLKCKSIYELLAEKNYTKIKNIFTHVFQRYGFSMLINYFYILYDSSNFTEDFDIYHNGKYTLQNILEGIGGWEN